MRHRMRRDRLLRDDPATGLPGPELRPPDQPAGRRRLRPFWWCLMRRAAIAALGAVLASGAIAAIPVAHADWCTDHGMTGVALTACEKGRALMGTPCQGNNWNSTRDPNGTLSTPYPEGCDPSLPYQENTGQ